MNRQKIQRDSYIFNTASGLLNAFQSVFILIVLNRTLGIEAAGIFSIAYAVANLMLNIGKYGMRNFQATDVEWKYTPKEYLNSRIITTVIMMAVSAVYIFLTARSLHYSASKSIIILLMCVWKCVDSVEDVIQGELQRQGRLDLGAMEFTYRQAISVIAYIVGFFVFDDLLLSTVVMTIVSIISAAILLIAAVKKNDGSRLPEKNKPGKGIFSLLKDCFPLFVSAFLAFYLINASKYAIDALMSEADQAKYGFIAMPVFVVGLLAQFIYMPILNDLAETYTAGKIAEFKSVVRKQILIIAGITAVVLLGGFLLGTPVLSILFGVDLNPLRTELCILLLGSGLLAYGNLMLTILTLMRRAAGTMIAFGAAALFELIFARIAVQKSGLMGASAALAAGMLILAVGMTVFYCLALKRSSDRN